MSSHAQARTQDQDQSSSQSGGASYDQDICEDNSVILARMAAGQEPDAVYGLRGGFVHTVVGGDTLFRIAEAAYGDGSYWPEIADANPEYVSNDGNLILVGSDLIVPMLEVPIGCVDDTGSTPAPAEETPPAQEAPLVEEPSLQLAPDKSGASGGGAGPRAVTCLLPTLQYDLSGLPSECVSNGDVTMTLELEGSVSIQQEGSCNPFTFDKESYSASASARLREMSTSLSVSASEDQATISSGYAGEFVASAVAIPAPNVIVYTCSPKPVEYKQDGWVVSGSMGYKLTITYHPRPQTDPVTDGGPAPTLDSPEWWEQYGGWIIAGGYVLIGVGVIAGTLVEDVLTGGAGVADDPVSFAFAASMFTLAGASL